TQPETQAIHAVIRDHQPELIVDWHEGANITNDYASAPAYNSNADAGLLSLSNDLNLAVKDAILDAGHTWEEYQGPSNMMRGPENLHNNAAVNGAVGLLLETERDYGDDTDAALRHALHM